MCACVCVCVCVCVRARALARTHCAVDGALVRRAALWRARWHPVVGIVVKPHVRIEPRLPYDDQPCKQVRLLAVEAIGHGSSVAEARHNDLVLGERVLLACEMGRGGSGRASGREVMSPPIILHFVICYVIRGRHMPERRTESYSRVIFIVTHTLKQALLAVHAWTHTCCRDEIIAEMKSTSSESSGDVGPQ